MLKDPWGSVDSSLRTTALDRDYDHVYVFLCIVHLAVRMVADVTETSNVIPSLEFKTCMIIKS